MRGASGRIVERDGAGGNTIGEYLRARRELIRPADAGLHELGRRRVSGLRREEVAMLAGVSVEYYVRLEQGRDQHPSAQVLDALARALQLDDDAAAHLHRLARPPARRRAQEPAARAGAGRHRAADRNLERDPRDRRGPLHGGARRQRRRHRAGAVLRGRARTSSAPPSSTHACATCTTTGRGSARARSRRCARWSAPTSTIRG